MNELTHPPEWWRRQEEIAEKQAQFRKEFCEDMATLQKMWDEMDAEPHVVREFGR